MKIGYPCINTEIGCTPNATFRLANFSEHKLKEKVNNNLNCLEKILEYNKKQGLLFFRISSDLIPFASHKICVFNWQKCFKQRFKEIGSYIKKNNIRTSMHPDQFVLINSLKEVVIKNSISELKWHCEVLNLMNLDSTAKVQIHVGGVYGDKELSIRRFIANYKKLPFFIKKRLVIENDEKSYSLKDCLKISELTKIPVLFDIFHHQCFNNGEKINKALKEAKKTWKEKDGLLMVDYSSQDPGKRTGKHIESIDINDFVSFINQAGKMDFDIMLEIKDKEKSAIKALKIVKNIFK
jgi:UV DNA damage endonuclease